MLGEKIASLRRIHNLSQYELAERLGFSRGKLANYEQGSRQPDYDSLKKIADFFSVSTDYLLGRTEKQEITDEERMFIGNIEKLSIEELKDKHILTIDGRPATKEEIEHTIAIIRSLRNLKK